MKSVFQQNKTEFSYCYKMFIKNATWGPNSKLDIIISKTGFQILTHSKVIQLNSIIS